VGVSVLVGVSVGLGVVVGVAVGTSPQADNSTDRNTNIFKNFFILKILLVNIRRYHTAFVPVYRAGALRLKRY
jgi:hypothetical protein